MCLPTRGVYESSVDVVCDWSVPEAADAGGQLLGPEDAVGDVEERVRRRRRSGRDGAASGAALGPEMD